MGGYYSSGGLHEISPISDKDRERLRLMSEARQRRAQGEPLLRAEETSYQPDTSGTDFAVGVATGVAYNGASLMGADSGSSLSYDGGSSSSSSGGDY